jgi:hypothetical protein
MASSPSLDGPNTPPASLVTALRRMLRPLVRLLLANGITYPFLSSLLKSVFVEVAERDFRLDAKAQTDSRINLLTGVHRKDVKRLRAELANTRAPETPAAVSLGAQLVARWTGLDRYLDGQGRPQPLPRLASEGGDLSFEALVAAVNKDIRSRVVLDEWLRLGVARIDDQDRVCLNLEAFVPDKGFDEKAYYFGQNIHDHIAATAHNLSGTGPAYLERSVYYDHLTPESVDTLDKMARDLGMQSLLNLNRKAMELQAQDQSKDSAQLRMNFGIYFFSEEEEPEADETPATKGRST